MTQKNIDFIIILSKLMAFLIVIVLGIMLCYQFITLSNLRQQKIVADNNLKQITAEQENKKNVLNYLQENYNEYLDDVAKDKLGLAKENHTVIYGV